MMRVVKDEGKNKNLIITLHGTGGEADSLFDIAKYLDSEADIVGIEGDVLENGMRRYFERYPNGAFKLKSLAKETQKLYETIKKIIEDYPDYKIHLVGYSNGSNIALNLFKEYDDIDFDKVFLFHPSTVRADIAYKKQEGTKFIITSGANDPFISEGDFKQLFEDLKKPGNEVFTFSHKLGHQLIQEELDFSKKVYGGSHE